MPLEKTLLVEVERLLGTMRRYAGRERDLQAAPDVTVFGPGLDFFGLDTRQGKQKRRIQVRPHRVASEVRELQTVPRGVQNVSRERLARIDPFLHDVAVVGFDGDSVGLKGCVPIRLSEWPM